MMPENKLIYGIVGYPVEHSLSPLMHNTAFAELGVNALYKLFPLKEDELDEFFIGLRSEESLIYGFNITVPYKETVLKYLDILTPFAEKVGAVNTVVINKERKLMGYNTDAPGFLSHLTELGFQTKNKRIAILGAGGVSRAMIAALCLIAERPQSIRIYDMVKKKADALVDDLSERIDLSNVEGVRSIDDLNIEISDFLINATPIGMQEGDPCLVEPQMLHSNMFVYDVVYNPEETALLREAKKRGARVSNGLGMLYYQGVLSFQHWANIALNDQIKQKMRKSLEKGVRK
ncbi:MAG: shikimate dehydrogenase [Candidatus Omnitrophica bacterium]|nr:shikimate dehydrogenase [Candidatus Omnitrophota bacterium]